MSRFHHQSNVLNHIKVIFLCSCSSLFCSPDIAQEKGTKLHFSIASSIERSRNCACFCAFRHLVFENQSIFGHNINRLFYSCGLLIAFFQILWAIIGWKTFLVSFFSGHWNLTARFICDVIMGRAIAWLRKQSSPSWNELNNGQKLDSFICYRISIRPCARNTKLEDYVRERLEVAR